MFRTAMWVIVSLVSGSVAQAMEISFSSEQTRLKGDPVSILVEGVEPGARVHLTLETDMTGRRPVRFRSSAEFIADEAGRVDTSDAASLAGTYTGTDEAGLFWSMSRASGPFDPIGENLFRVSARVGETSGMLEFALPISDPAVIETSVDELPGAVLYRLPGDRQRPAIILLGGSEGGLSTARDLGPALASRGYAVLALGYYSPDWGGGREIPELPASFVDLPIERLAEARDWLRRQAGIHADTVGVMGLSKGAEFALLGCSKYAWIAATAAIVPSDVVWEGWGPASAGTGLSSSFSWQGEPLPFTPYEGSDAYFGAFERGARPDVTLASVHMRGRWAHPARAAAARIDVAACRGEVLVAGGGEDTIWPSAVMAGLVAERRAAAGLATISIISETAGHGLGGPGFTPATEYGSGGDPSANGRTQVEAWRASLSLFERQLWGRLPPE